MARIVAALDATGVDVIEVVHGDGLAGGSLNYGPGSNTDREGIEAAADGMESATLTTLLLPGIGTVAELEHAYALEVRSVRIDTHGTEADIAAQHIARARDLGMDVSGFLMMRPTWRRSKTWPLKRNSWSPTVRTASTSPTPAVSGHPIGSVS